MKRTVRRSKQFKRQWQMYGAASSVGLKAMGVIDANLAFLENFDDAVEVLTDKGQLVEVENSAGVFELRPRNVSYFVKLVFRPEFIQAEGIYVIQLTSGETEVPEEKVAARRRTR